MKKQIETTVEHDGYSTIRVRASTLRSLWLYRRIVGYASFDKLFKDIIAKEDLLGYLCDLHPARAFELENLGLNKREIELPRNSWIVKKND